MKSQLEELRQLMLAGYKTPHAFCRAHPDIKRSTVYQVLAGKYPGNLERQIQRIKTALTGIEFTPAPQHPELTELEVYTVLQQTKCAHCRRHDKRACPECNTQTTREAQAIAEYVSLRR